MYLVPLTDSPAKLPFLSVTDFPSLVVSVSADFFVNMLMFDAGFADPAGVPADRGCGTGRGFTDPEKTNMPQH